MSQLHTADCFPENLLGTVESTQEILARAATTGIHLINQLPGFIHKSVGYLLSAEGRFYMDEVFFAAKTSQPPLAGYDDLYATTPSIHRRFDESIEDEGRAAQTFGPKESLVFHFFGYKDVYPLWPNSSALLWSDGQIDFGTEQPFIDTLPLDKPFGEMDGPNVEKIRLLQNIIHCANRAALMSISLAAASNLVEIPGDATEETAALQRKWHDIFTETAGQDHAIYNGATYRPGIHLSLLSHYAVMDGA